VDKDEVHNLFMNVAHFYYSRFMNKQNPHSWANKKVCPAASSATVTQCEGCSVVCDTIFWDYWPLFLGGQL
jgi:hypothetical protein